MEIDGSSPGHHLATNLPLGYAAHIHTERRDMQVTIAEAAERLRLSEHTVRRRVKSGELPSTQVATPQGFVWMVELPDDSPAGESDTTSEVRALRELIDQMANQLLVMKDQLESKDHQLESKDRQIEQLHVLLQQAQAALPVPKEVHHSWWRRLWHH